MLEFLTKLTSNVKEVEVLDRHGSIDGLYGATMYCKVYTKDCGNFPFGVKVYLNKEGITKVEPFYLINHLIPTDKDCATFKKRLKPFFKNVA